jgi:uncharacterized protein YukE
MPAEIIQAHYENLENIAGTFSQQAASLTELSRRVDQQASILINGAWQGKGVAAFTKEIEADLLPTCTRCSLPSTISHIADS